MSHSAGHYLWCLSVSSSQQVVLPLQNYPETSISKILCFPQCGTECKIRSWKMCYYNTDAVLWSSEVLIINSFSNWLKWVKKHFFYHFKCGCVCVCVYQEVAAQIVHRSSLFCLSVFQIFFFMYDFLFKVLNSTTCLWNCAYPESLISGVSKCVLFLMKASQITIL